MALARLSATRRGDRVDLGVPAPKIKVCELFTTEDFRCLTVFGLLGWSQTLGMRRSISDGLHVIKNRGERGMRG